MYHRTTKQHKANVLFSVRSINLSIADVSFFALFFACFTVKLGAFFSFRLLEHKNSPGFTVNVKIPEKGMHIIGASARLPHLLKLVHKLQTYSGGGDDSRCMVWRG